MKSRNVFALVVLCLVAAFTLPRLFVSAHEGGPHVRVAHLAAGAPAVDVYVEGKLVFDGVKFKDVTDYAALEGEEFKVVIVPAGGKLTDSVTKSPISLTFKEGDNGFYTLAAIGSLKDGPFEVVMLPLDGPKGGVDTMKGTAEPTAAATAKP